MKSPYRIKTIVMANGERLPALLDAATGVPLYGPMAFILTAVRSRDRAANTIRGHLTAIECLLIHADTCGIDLGERVSSGGLLDLNEIDGVVGAAKATIAELLSRLEAAMTIESSSPKRPRSITPFKPKRLPEAAGKFVIREVADIRLRVIRAYLNWIARQRLGRLDPGDEAWAALEAQRKFVDDSLEARQPNGTRSKRSKREALQKDEREVLLALVEPSNPANPWQDPRVKIRNQLIVHYLYHFGMRNGELLSLWMQDINARSGQVSIVRRPDEIRDPRADQPVVKTLPRILEMNSELIEMTMGYIAVRRNIIGYGEFPFFFIETDHGRPLSKRALANIFRDIREAGVKTPIRLSPHVLRHDWNERFSDKMDEKGVPEATAEKIRSHDMGWSEGSGTAATYNGRHTERKSAEISRDMQAEVFKKGKDVDR